MDDGDGQDQNGSPPDNDRTSIGQQKEARESEAGCQGESCCFWESDGLTASVVRGLLATVAAVGEFMTEITTMHYLVVAAALFIIGTIGVLTRRNVVIILMSIELILNAVNLNLVAFSRLWGMHGQVFAIFVITDAAAEAAVGLGIIIAFFRNKETVNVDEVDLLKW
jgi:NADH-quinone oxidoreductase subunit K